MFFAINICSMEDEKIKTAIMQPYFFPYIGYWQLISSVDNFIIYDDVNYIKKGWINRNNILIDGRPHQITLPLKKASQNKKINEIELLNDKIKKDKILPTIEKSYSKAPHFAEILPLLKSIFFFQATIWRDF